MSSDRRETQYEEARVAQNKQELAEAEARNGLLQYDYAVQVIMEAIDRKAFRLRPPLLLNLHREALQGISQSAGTWRAGAVSIKGSGHAPIHESRVAEEIEVLCDYVNERWETASALHLSAYVMWRLNWIHHLRMATDAPQE